jgi:GNAT superfamily N-acetyltransferase
VTAGTGITIRPGGVEDLPVTLAMFDSAVAWLVANGRSGQWGNRPWSSRPDTVAKVGEMMRQASPWVAEVDGEPAGTITLSQIPLSEYIAAADEPEVYIHLLVIDRRFSGLGVGSALLAHACDEARRLGVGLVRVDCYAGSGGRLVDYYRRNGFEPVETFTVGEWPGRVLARRV